MSSHAPNASSDTAPKPVVGWVGAGKMGTPMIRHLIARGTPVSVTEPSLSRLEPLLSDGASEAASLADHGSADIVFSTLPNDQILRDVVFRIQRPARARGSPVRQCNFCRNEHCFAGSICCSC